jgi:site-specific DNA-cytosine methylase
MKDKRKIKVVGISTFSGIDLLGIGAEKAGIPIVKQVEFNQYAARASELNFRDADGNSLITWVKPSDEEMNLMLKKLEDEKKEKERKHILKTQYVKQEDGSYLRPQRIQEVDGKALRKALEKKYGKNVIIILFGGPPCQDWSKLQSGEDKGRRELIHQYKRVLKELNADLAIMEEVPDVVNKNNIEVFSAFLEEIHDSGYQVAYRLMNALHYDGCQNRERCICIFVNNKLSKQPVFPEPRPESANRIGDVFTFDHLFSGHFTDEIKTKYQFAGTVTSGSPLWVADDFEKREPTIHELLTLQGLPADTQYIFPEDMPKQQIKLGIGNGVPVNLAFWISKTIMEEILEIPVEYEYKPVTNKSKKESCVE